MLPVGTILKETDNLSNLLQPFNFPAVDDWIEPLGKIQWKKGFFRYRRSQSSKNVPTSQKCCTSQISIISDDFSNSLFLRLWSHFNTLKKRSNRPDIQIYLNLQKLKLKDFNNEDVS